MSSRRRSKKDAASTVMPPQAPPSQYSRRERVLYVGCEGEATEYDYLRYLNKEFGSGDSETGRPPFTIKPVRKADGLIPSRAVKAVVEAAQGEDETWVLFDRDSHHDIPEAFEAAAASDTEVCFSHPSFELWLLLHFQPFGGAQGAAKNTHVLEKLRKADPAYKRFDKPDKGLGDARTKALKGKEAAAVRNARALVGQCEHGSCKPANATFEWRIGALERELGKLRTVENAVVAGAMAESGDRIELGRWLSSIEAGKSPMAEDTPAGDGEWGVLKVSAVQPGWFKATENKVVREAEFVNARYTVCTGDLLMTRANTEELVGLACVVRERAERLMLSDKTLRLVPDTGVADAEFIELALLSPSVRSQVRSRATGTSASMKNIGQSAVRQLMVPDVPKDVQRRVVAAVSASRKRSQGIQRQIAKLRHVQRGVIEDLLSGRTRVTRT